MFFVSFKTTHIYKRFWTKITVQCFLGWWTFLVWLFNPVYLVKPFPHTLQSLTSFNCSTSRRHADNESLQLVSLKIKFEISFVTYWTNWYLFLPSFVYMFFVSFQTTHIYKCFWTEITMQCFLGWWTFLVWSFNPVYLVKHFPHTLQSLTNINCSTSRRHANNESLQLVSLIFRPT